MNDPWIRERKLPWGSKTEQNIVFRKPSNVSHLKDGDSHEYDNSGHSSKTLYKPPDWPHHGYAYGAGCSWTLSQGTTMKLHQIEHTAKVYLIQQDCTLIIAFPDNVSRSVLNLKTQPSLRGIHTHFLDMIMVSFFRMLLFLWSVHVCVDIYVVFDNYFGDVRWEHFA